jgi:type IV secretory pathway protease TraF
MLLAAGVTVTVGVVAGTATVTELVPDALLYVAELAASGVYAAVSVSEPAASDPAGIVIVAEPELSVAEDDV